MSDKKKLFEKASKGFKTLNIPEKYKESALKNLEEWLIDEAYHEYAYQLSYLIESEKWNFLLDSFYQTIPFGTGGRRGMVGIGTNRINIITIKSSAQGHSQYLIQKYGDDAKLRGVVLTFDVRKYTQAGIYNDDMPNPVMNLDCRQLAIAAAEVYAANGLKVYLFEDIRSTPELSYAIRHLKAISGVMFSASHNSPTDNGKKVYDDLGGQLIPPFDQNLVDEVSNNVVEIKEMSLNIAIEKGLIEYVGEKIDESYYKEVCSLSLSDERAIKILYSPLHGTGITSVYPVLKKLNFDVTLDPNTKNLSGAFENVTFNIPNPEVIESFDKILPSGDELEADIILSTDPDADRIGIMVKHQKNWSFLNGNEICIILTNYGITKYKQKGLLNKNSIIIKTAVTTSLVKEIALNNDVQCISDLLVGFKYIGNEMNKLERENKIHNFILGAEESHGYIMGNYARDKDAAGAGVWLSELAAELKKENKTLVDYLDEIYSAYGYCNNYLTEIRLLGAVGMEQISEIMNHMRNNAISNFDDFSVIEKIDRRTGDPQPHLSKTDTSSRNVLIFNIKNISNTKSIQITLRPSGTEPKIKMYFEIFGMPFDLKDIENEKNKIVEIRNKLEKAFMKYCYEIINIDFPDRGFLLFWQLPLNDKLKYFEIEDQIVALKDIEDKKEKKTKLNTLLDFLGANPIEKIDKAFSQKFGVGVIEYLDILD